MIGIIDGYFERVPSVWHKEILWAMNQGIHVFGSASMGALRAAELTAFGMEGVGRIFEDYRNGILEDDDEVAIMHGQKENGFICLSEAMVNIRYTFLAAMESHIISRSTCNALIEIGKRLYYPERSYSRILDQAADSGFPKNEIMSLSVWLKEGKINQKEIDALSMLRIMKQKLNNNYRRKIVRYSFEYTDMWNHCCDTAGTISLNTEKTDGDMIFFERLMDEIRLDSQLYSQTMAELNLRFLRLREFQRYCLIISETALKDTTEKFRRDRDIIETEDLLQYMQENELSREDFVKMMEEEAKVELLNSFKPELLKYLPNYLRVIGKYEKILKRTIDKQRILESNFMTSTDLPDLALTDSELIKWFFEERLNMPLIDDIEKYVKDMGFNNKNELLRTLKREYHYLKKLEENQNHTSA